VAGWRIKAHVLAVASRTPGGRALYQRYSGIKAGRMHDAEEMFGRACDLLDLYRHSGGVLSGRDCLEIGTGWCPWVPLLLSVGGAHRIVTVDINPWLTLRTAVATTRAVLARREVIANMLGGSAGAGMRRLEEAEQARSLNDWLSMVGVVYHHADLLTAGLPAGSFDLVVSSNVLEHVPPGVLKAIHTESDRLLRAGGRIVHRFNPQDHFAGGDSSITGANFVQFSESEWRWLGGSGLSYHNRLRCRQHRVLIEQAGFDVVVARTRPDPAARRAIETGALRVHPDFAGFDSVDLTDDYMWVVAQKQGAAASPTNADQCETARADRAPLHGSLSGHASPAFAGGSR
jgi:SAM-dependent methyltransferase